MGLSLGAGWWSFTHSAAPFRADGIQRHHHRQILLDQSQELLQAELWHVVLALAAVDVDAFFTSTLVAFLASPSVPWVTPAQASAIAADAAAKVKAEHGSVTKDSLQQLLDDVRCIKPADPASAKRGLFGL